MWWPVSDEASLSALRSIDAEKKKFIKDIRKVFQIFL